MSNQSIFRLEVSVQNIQRVQILYGQNNLSAVKFSLPFGELVEPDQMFKHLAARNKLEHNVEICGVFERRGKRCYEREVNRARDFLLVYRVFDLSRFHNVFFNQNLNKRISFYYYNIQDSKRKKFLLLE